MASPIDSPEFRTTQDLWNNWLIDRLEPFLNIGYDEERDSPIDSPEFRTERYFGNKVLRPVWVHDVDDGQEEIRCPPGQYTVVIDSADLWRLLLTDSQYSYDAKYYSDDSRMLRGSLTGQFDPASHRRLTYPSGGFHQQAFCLSNSRCFHTSVVHDQRLLTSTRVEEQPLHRVWVPSQLHPVPSTHPGSPSQLHPGSHAMLDLIQHPTGVEEQQLFNRPRLPETFLGITSQSSLTMLTIWISSSTSFSQNAKILFCSAAACNVIGFLFCLFSILLSGRKTGVAHRIVTGTGFVFTAYGFLAIMGMLLSDNIMLWVTGLACIASFPALASAFMK